MSFEGGACSGQRKERPHLDQGKDFSEKEGCQRMREEKTRRINSDTLVGGWASGTPKRIEVKDATGIEEEAVNKRAPN